MSTASAPRASPLRALLLLLALASQAPAAPPYRGPVAARYGDTVRLGPRDSDEGGAEGARPPTVRLPRHLHHHDARQEAETGISLAATTTAVPAAGGNRTTATTTTTITTIGAAAAAASGSSNTEGGIVTPITPLDIAQHMGTVNFPEGFNLGNGQA